MVPMEEKAGTLQQTRILVVEDSRLQADLLEYILTQNRYEVACARNGLEAMEMINDSKPFLIISDIVMPLMDGFELCRKIKADDRLRDVPVMLLTALSDPEDVLKGLECGADCFITKPYDETYLLAQISHVILNRHLREEYTSEPPLEILFKGQKYLITSARRQILDLLLSTYDTAVVKNRQLKDLKEELEMLNESLERKVDQRTTALVSEIVERKKAEEELRRHREHLEETVEARTVELRAANERLSSEVAERREAEKKIQRLNTDLERHAKDLEIANKDLESFSYSVSHDLKAPLRAVSGFSEILMERYAVELPPEAARLLGLVHDNAKKMGQLIDEILAFSKAGRGEVRAADIDVEKVVASLVEELKPLWEGRSLVFEIKPLRPARGDAGAVRQVFYNLLSNSIKFTRPKPAATIEIGSDEQGMENIYYVRDNGVGFDHRQVDRLFGIFRRLHSPKDFEGTGIGLAIVKRIVNKLGGKVWAEGEEDKGATFFFSLPKAGSRRIEVLAESQGTT